MGLKRLFTLLFSVLVHPELFWQESRKALRDLNAMRDYAAPVIAMVQFVKLPFIAVPRMAMLLAISCFIVDVAVLFLFSGTLYSLSSCQRSESAQHDILTVLSFSMTPVWLVEPFYFTGWLRWVLMVIALLYAVVITRLGIQAMFRSEHSGREVFSWKTGFLVAAATLISFMLISGLTRFFTSF